MSTNNIINLGKNAFYAQLSSSVYNVCGDATNYSIIFDVAQLNENSCYNTATGVFTAPNAGNFMLGFAALIDGVVAQATGKTFFYHNIVYRQVGYVNTLNGTFGTGMQLIGSIMLPLAQGDTIAAVVQVANDTKTVDVLGYPWASGTVTYFYGYQVL